MVKTQKKYIKCLQKTEYKFVREKKINSNLGMKHNEKF